MSYMKDLVLKIEDLIKYEKTINSNIHYLNTSHAKMIAQILEELNLSKRKVGIQGIYNAEMVFIGAPTGTGKDTLVRKIKLENPEKAFIVLNMDMYRHHYKDVIGANVVIPDKDYASATNQVSYEIYYILQEIILREFPGTNIIITGTMKDLNWVTQIVKRYKYDKKTKYKISLLTLAVPENENIFSIFERYLRLVDKNKNEKGPLRYTSLDYHEATCKNFISNVKFFENTLNNKNSLFDSIKVYRRNKDMFDFSEDTLVYDSDKKNINTSAETSINNIITSNIPIEKSRANNLLSIIDKNTEYLKSQGVYTEIISGLSGILPGMKEDKYYKF